MTGLLFTFQISHSNTPAFLINKQASTSVSPVWNTDVTKICWETSRHSLFCQFSQVLSLVLKAFCSSHCLLIWHYFCCWYCLFIWVFGAVCFFVFTHCQLTVLWLAIFPFLPLTSSEKLKKIYNFFYLWMNRHSLFPTRLISH